MNSTFEKFHKELNKTFAENFCCLPHEEPKQLSNQGQGDMNILQAFSEYMNFKNPILTVI